MRDILWRRFYATGYYLMAKTRQLIAFDLGASNGRAILGRFDGEIIRMEELHRFENHYIEMNGVYYWDTPYLYEECKKGLTAFAKKDSGALDAFGIDSWGVDYGLLDKNGQLLSLQRSYRLGTQEDIDAVTDIIPADELFDRCGIDTGLTFNTLYQLYRRKREHDPALAAAEKLLFTPDLLAYFLTGETGTEYTMATTSQLYNPTLRDWDRDLIRRLGLPEHILTEVEPSATVRGKLRSAVQEDTGLNAAVFASVGSHDTASSVAAIPGKGSFAFCSSGTWSLIGVETDQPELGKEAAARGFSNEGTVQGGFQPLRNINGLWIIQECRREWMRTGKDLSWGDVVAAAEQEKPFVSVIDTDAPEFYDGGRMEEKIREYCKRTGQPVPETIGQTARCVYESLALKYRIAVEGLEKIKGQRIDSLNIVGGGIQNRLLDQMAADALDRNVITGPIEGAAIGNLLTQAMALGDIGSIDELRDVVRASSHVEVWEPRHTDEWEQAYGRLCELIGQS